MKISDKEKTEIMLNALIQKHTVWGKARSNVIFPELRLGSGYCGVAERRIDLFVISSAEGNTSTAFEIKASRGDFLKDINNDLKQRGARLYSNYVYYVAPKGMIKSEEIPVWAGLLEFDFDKLADMEDRKREHYLLLSNSVPAPLTSRVQPSWGLICSMIRHINKDVGKATIADLNEQIRQLKITLKSQKDLLKRIANNETFNSWELSKYREV